MVSAQMSPHPIEMTSRKFFICFYTICFSVVSSRLIMKIGSKLLSKEPKGFVRALIVIQRPLYFVRLVGLYLFFVEPF